MSSTRSRPRGPLRLFLGLAVLVLMALGFVRLGTFFWRNDPLAHADVIHVLAGSRMERPLEAAMLYREGYSPLLLLLQWNQGFLSRLQELFLLKNQVADSCVDQNLRDYL